jgi:hypothetical protein
MTQPARTLTDADVEAIAAKLAELVGRDPPANERPRRRGQHTRRVARPEVAEDVARRMRRIGR